MLTLDRNTPHDIQPEQFSTWRALSYPRYAYCVDGRQFSTEEEEEQYPYHESLSLVGIATYNSVPVLHIPVPSSPSLL